LDHETTYYVRQLLKISKKIETRKFNSFQEADRLVKQETQLVCTVATLLHLDLYSRSKRYFDDPFDF